MRPFLNLKKEHEGFSEEEQEEKNMVHGATDHSRPDDGAHGGFGVC